MISITNLVLNEGFGIKDEKNGEKSFLAKMDFAPFYSHATILCVALLHQKRNAKISWWMQKTNISDT